MQRIDFFQLERPIQERFVAAARGAAAPVPLASQREPFPRGVLVWGGVALLSLVSLVLLGSLGYGELRSGWALQPGWVLVVYAALAGFSLFAGLRAVALHLHAQSLPFVRAVYLFPSGVVDTRGKSFVVRPLAELRELKVRDRVLWATFADGSRFRFKVSGRAAGEEIEQQLTHYGARLHPDAAPVSARERAAWDPLKDNGFSNPFSPSERMREPKLPFRWIGPVVALALGPLLGYGVLSLRNRLAEDALYASARHEDTLEAYREYTTRGGTRDEIADILLPRAELAAVIAKQDLSALEAYALTRRGSAIWPEIERALQAALLAELDSVRKQGTRAALRGFQAKYEKHAVIAPAIERAVSDHRARALARFAAEAKPSAEVFDFFRRLLVYTDTHGPRVELRYERKLADSVARTETQLRKSVFFGGESSLPGQYFDASHSEKREAELSRAFSAQFARAFPPDVLELSLAPALSRKSDDLPKVTVPTLLVTHRTEMSGAYLSKQPRAAYTGVGILFRVSFQIPGDDKPFLYNASTWYAPALREIRNGASFQSIYGEMGAKAFAKASKRCLSELFPGFSP